MVDRYIKFKESQEIIFQRNEMEFRKQFYGNAPMNQNNDDSSSTPIQILSDIGNNEWTNIGCNWTHDESSVYGTNNEFEENGDNLRSEPDFIDYEQTPMQRLSDKMSDCSVDVIPAAPGTFQCNSTSLFTVSEAMNMIIDENFSSIIHDEIQIGDKSNRYLFLSKGKMKKRTSGSLIFYDECGKYLRTGHIYHYWISQKKVLKLIKDKFYLTRGKEMGSQPLRDDVTKVYIYDYILVGLPTFKRRIIYSDINDLILVQYLGTYNFSQSLAPASNPSVIKDIKEILLKNDKPTQVYKQLAEKEEVINLK